MCLGTTCWLQQRGSEEWRSHAIDIHQALRRARLARWRSSSAAPAGAFADTNPNKGSGQCVEGAWDYFHARWGHGPGINGDAHVWDNAARRLGLPVGRAPRVGAIVVFEKGAQGASRQYGHVGYVVKRYSAKRFRIKEMNARGLGVTSYRTVRTGRGVSFIYHSGLMGQTLRTAAMVDRMLFLKQGILDEPVSLVSGLVKQYAMDGERVGGSMVTAPCASTGGAG